MITRYDIERVDYEEFEMVECEYGDYVKFDDYEDELFNVQYDLKALQRKYDLLVGKIGELYREA